MYGESRLGRLRRMHPELDERALQIENLLDSQMGSREFLPNVRAWLDDGGDPNAVSAMYGQKSSVLYVAMTHGQVESVRLLLACGARVENSHLCIAQHGCSPERATLPIVRLLVSAGADVKTSPKAVAFPLEARPLYLLLSCINLTSLSTS